MSEAEVFQRALAFVLRWEGGYVDHPQDPGGATNMGITQATYDRWRRSQGLPTRPVRDISREEAAAIYRVWYWAPLAARYAKQDPALALALFDLSVNSGLGRAREALSAAGEDWRRVVAYRLQFLASLGVFQVFGRGWVRRVAALVEECAELDPPLSQARRFQVLGEDHEPRPLKKASIMGDKLYIRPEAT